MADLTLQEIFGSGASFDPNGSTITFSLWDVSMENGGFTPDNINASNIDEYTSKILWTIIQNVTFIQPENNNEEDRGIYVTNQGKRTVTRNGVAQFAFQLVVTGYTNDTLGVDLSPDEMV